MSETVEVTEYNPYVPQRKSTEQLEVLFDTHFSEFHIRGESLSSMLLGFFMAVTLMRAYKSFRAVDVLMSAGLKEDATAICRGLLESLINVKWVLAQDTEARVQLYAEYEKTHLKKLRNAFIECAPGQEIPDAFQGDEPTNSFSSWSGKSIRQMAQEAGLESEYICHYFQLCDYTHGNASIAGKYLNVGALLDQEEEDDHWTPAPFFANYYFQQILLIGDEQLNIGVHDELTRIAEQTATASLYEQALIELWHLFKICQCYLYEIKYKDFDRYAVIVKTTDDIPIFEQELVLETPKQSHFVVTSDDIRKAAVEFVHRLHDVAGSCQATDH